MSVFKKEAIQQLDKHVSSDERHNEQEHLRLYLVQNQQVVARYKDDCLFGRLVDGQFTYKINGVPTQPLHSSELVFAACGKRLPNPLDHIYLNNESLSVHLQKAEDLRKATLETIRNRQNVVVYPASVPAATASIPTATATATATADCTPIEISEEEEQQEQQEQQEPEQRLLLIKAKTEQLQTELSLWLQIKHYTELNQTLENELARIKASLSI